MAGNAHRNRHRNNRCGDGCKYCACRPKFGSYANRNGNRHNPASKRRGKRAKK